MLTRYSPDSPSLSSSSGDSKLLTEIDRYDIKQHEARLNKKNKKRINSDSDSDSDSSSVTSSLEIKSNANKKIISQRKSKEKNDQAEQKNHYYLNGIHEIDLNFNGEHALSQIEDVNQTANEEKEEKLNTQLNKNYTKFHRVYIDEIFNQYIPPKRPFANSKIISPIQKEAHRENLKPQKYLLSSFCNDLELANDFNNKMRKEINVLEVALAASRSKNRQVKENPPSFLDRIFNTKYARQARAIKQNHELNVKKLTELQRDLDNYKEEYNRDNDPLLNKNVSANSKTFDEWLDGFLIPPAINRQDMKENLSLLNRTKNILYRNDFDQEKSDKIQKFLDQKINELKTAMLEYPAKNRYFSPIDNFVSDTQRYHKITEEFNTQLRERKVEYNNLFDVRSELLKSQQPNVQRHDDVEKIHKINGDMDALKVEISELRAQKWNLLQPIGERYSALFTEGSVNDEDFVDFLNRYQYLPGNSPAQLVNYLEDISVAKEELKKPNPFEKNRAKAFYAFLQQQEKALQNL